MPQELFGFGIVPIVVALVELAKTTGVPTKFAPVAALAAGLLAGLAVQASVPHPNWLQAIVYGVAYGLSASGLYSGIQAFTQPGDPPKPQP